MALADSIHFLHLVLLTKYVFKKLEGLIGFSGDGPGDCFEIFFGMVMMGWILV